MNSSLLVLVCAVSGYTILSVSQAGQKIGLHEMARRPARGIWIWLLATGGTAVSFFLVLAAIGIGSVALVGAMTGIGMAALSVFSHFILRERIGRREIVGVSLIAVGAGIAGAVPLAAEGVARTRLLYWSVASVTGVYAVAAILVARRHHTGMILGGLAGSMAAFSQLFQKLGARALSVDQGIRDLIVQVLASRPIIVSVVITIVSMLVAQLAYTRGRAIRIIPSYTAHASAVPVLGGTVVFGEQLTAVHWLGITMLFGGTTILLIDRPDAGGDR